MTASDSIRYRLALADGFLREATQDRELERWRSCVDNSQLVVENSGKALLLLFGVSPKTHDPGRQIANLIAAGGPPEHLRAGLAEIASDLLALGPAEHVLTDYGDEATETLPWDLFSQDSAVQALALAERVLDHTRRLLTLQEESGQEARAEPSAEQPLVRSKHSILITQPVLCCSVRVRRPVYESSLTPAAHAESRLPHQ